MDFLPGFAWPVPRAFASAVAAGRFEQGDVFYDAPGGYDAWGPEGPVGVSCWVQVLDPPRTARSAPSDADGSRFAANWSSPATLELAGPGGVRPAVVRCSQGRLFSCLWHGARELLVESPPGEPDEPPLPRGARELQKHLATAVAALRTALAAAGRGVLFASVVDESSESSLAKQRAIESCLASRYEPVGVSLSPIEAGVPDGNRFHPALRVHATGVVGGDRTRVAELLKGALYAPSRSGGEPGTDRFKLERHGLLLDAAAEDGASG